MEQRKISGTKQARLSPGSYYQGKVNNIPPIAFSFALIDHLRYPTFIDAIRDVDDALCMMFLFASLPSTSRVPSALIENCARLSAEWQQYIIHARSLRKAFLSIKGVYYQAEVMNETVTWLVPYQFPQSVGHFLRRLNLVDNDIADTC
jgi:hypothetical protein